MKSYLFYICAAVLTLGLVSTSWAQYSSMADPANMGKLSSVQEYDSSIDDLLLAYLGSDLYESNVVKLKSHARCFTLIGDQHNDEKFGNLFDQLVEEAKIQERDFALLIEGLARHTVSEEGGLNAGGENSLRLFGMEDQNLTDLTGYVVRFYYLLKLENVDSSEWPTLLQDHEQLMCHEVWSRAEIRERLDQLKNKDRMLEALITSLEQIVDQANNLNEINELLRALPHFSNTLWATLYKEMALNLMPNMNLPDDQTMIIQATLNDPYDILAFWDFSNEIVLNARNEAMRANIDQAIKSLPKGTEVVIFVGAAHIPDIFQGLQTMRPVKDEL